MNLDALVHGLNRPAEIQSILDTITYVPRSTDVDLYVVKSARRALEDREGICIDGALAGAALLEVMGFQPLLLTMRTSPLSHAVAAYEQDGLWGSVGVSSQKAGRERPPVYGSVRELAFSYRDAFANPEYGGYWLTDLSTIRPYDWRHSGPFLDGFRFAFYVREMAQENVLHLSKEKLNSFR